MKEVVLDRSCFKIEKVNAKAMITGYEKEGERTYQSIYCATRGRYFPRLITLNKRPTRFKLSAIGRTLESEYWPLTEYKHIALLEKEYSIKNDLDFWKRICNNGLFDIWEPIAPYSKFSESNMSEDSYRILLLRVYEIENGFNELEIEARGTRNHTITRNNLNVIIKKPVIEDEKFKEIKNLLEESISDRIS